MKTKKLMWEIILVTLAGLITVGLSVAFRVFAGLIPLNALCGYGCVDSVMSCKESLQEGLVV